MGIYLTERRVSRSDPRGSDIEVAASYELAGASEQLTCNVCGCAAPTAYWRGHEVIAVCRRCGTDALPALIADAVIGERILPGTDEVIRRAWEQVELRFWRAVASGLMYAERLERNTMPESEAIMYHDRPSRRPRRA